MLAKLKELNICKKSFEKKIIKVCDKNTNRSIFQALGGGGNHFK